MRTLLLIRHGEPATHGVLLGRTDPPLSSAGLEQCSTLRIEADVFYSSPLLRAMQSAEALAVGRPIIVDQDLREISYGEWDGMTWSGIEERWPQVAAAKIRDWQSVTPPGGEPWTEFTARVDRALDRIRRSTCRTMAIVAHAGVNAWIAHRLSGIDPVSFTQPWGGVITYDL